jgi:hypothetical protein
VTEAAAPAQIPCSRSSSNTQRSVWWLTPRSIGGSGTIISSSPAVRPQSSSGRPLPPARPMPPNNSGC